MGRVVLLLQRDEQGNRSQSQVRVKRQKALRALKAADDREEQHYDPARKDNILGRKMTRLELWEEHLKDPIIALDKA